MGRWAAAVAEVGLIRLEAPEEAGGGDGANFRRRFRMKPKKINLFSNQVLHLRSYVKIASQLHNHFSDCPVLCMPQINFEI